MRKAPRPGLEGRRHVFREMFPPGSLRFSPVRVPRPNLELPIRLVTGRAAYQVKGATSRQPRRRREQKAGEGVQKPG